jgi:hypothetical protein
MCFPEKVPVRSVELPSNAETAYLLLQPYKSSSFQLFLDLLTIRNDPKSTTLMKASLLELFYLFNFQFATPPGNLNKDFTVYTCMYGAGIAQSV